MLAGGLVRRGGWVSVIAIVAAAAAVGLCRGPAVAGDLAQLDCSLKLIPADAAFYGAMLRNREQVDAVVDSRAWAKLTDMAVVQMGLGFYNLQAADPESPVGKLHAALEDPEVKKLLALAKDMVSSEIFVYGDARFVDALGILQEIGGAGRYGADILRLTGETGGLDENELRLALVLGVIAESADRLQTPNLVIGFKLSDTAAAEEQLARLKELAVPLVDSNPQTKGRLKTAQVAGGEFLVLSLDGEMVPWTDLPMEKLEDVELEEGDTKKAVEALRKLKLVVALGLRDDYLLLAIGSSTDVLGQLREGPHRLIERKELKPLAGFTDERLTSISFLSAEMVASLSTNKQDLDDMLEVVDELLPLAELEPAEEEKIRQDAAALAEDLKRFIPDYGATMGFSFLTDRGVESYQYDWTEYRGIDGSKPLPLLKHVGGDPWLAVVGRARSSPEDYDLLVKWLKTGYRYFEKYAVPRMSKREQREFHRAMGVARPLLKRVDQINREMLIPALADGQAGLVLDAKLTSRRFINALPATREPMPMVEPALVVGVSDAGLLRKAFGAYQDVLDDLLDAVREAEPGAIPADYVIPRPKAKKTGAGTVYSYTLPGDWGLDKKIAPSLGLSESVGVVALTPDHAERLLTETPLSAGGAIADPDRPLAAAMVFDFAGLVDALTPWINLAIEQGMKDSPMQAAMVASQVRIVLDVIKVLRTVTSESYFEDGALVTHSLTEIRDIEE